MKRQGAINLAGAIVKIAAAAVAVPLTVRFCGLEEFGRWAFLFSLATIFSTFDLGLPTTVNVFVARGLGGDDTTSASARVAFIAASCFVVAGVVGTAAAATVAFGPHVPRVSTFFPTGSSNVVLAASMGLYVGSRIVSNVAAAFLQAKTDYGAYVLIGLTFLIPTAVGLPLAALAGWHATGFLHLHTAASVSSTVAYLVPVARMRRDNGWTWTTDTREWARMARYAIGSWVAGAGGIVFSQCDRLVVAALLSNRELGIYAAATQITSQINTLSAIPVQPLLPFLSRWSRDIRSDARELQRLFIDAVRVNAAVALTLSGAVAIFSPVLASIFAAHADAASAAAIIRLLAWIYGAYSLNAVGFYSLFATRDLMPLCLITVGSGVITLSTIGAGAWFAGLSGAAWGNATFIATLALNGVALARLRLSRHKWLRVVWFPIVAWAAAMLVVSVGEIQNLFAASASAAALAAILFWCAFTGSSAETDSVGMSAASETAT